MDLLSEQEEISIIIDNLLQIAIEHKDKSDELSGFPYNIYEKLNAPNPEERQIQALIQVNLWLKAVDDLYYYIDVRGKKIKKMIRDNIHLFSDEL